MNIFKAKDPKDIKFTLTTTRSLGDWIAIRDTFKTDEDGYISYPASEYITDIQGMISQAEEEFYPRKGD